MGYTGKAVTFIIVACATMASGTSHRKIACKVPANADSCYWVHGRLAAYNGAPSFRLWKIGTHRLLGIYSGPKVRDAGDNEHPEFPHSIEGRLKPFDTSIVADFEVCPLEEEKPNTMQAACIESAKNIVVQELNQH